MSNFINQGQIGLNKYSRTTDHVFTLKILINKYVYDNKNYIHVSSTSKKPLNSIWHKGLFNKLDIDNINGEFWHKGIFNKLDINNINGEFGIKVFLIN